MFTISVETCFSASHQLNLPDGSKESRHNHDWIVKTIVTGVELNDCNMLIDFVALKSMVDNITADLHDKQLEGLDCFTNNNPTAEAVAKYIYEKLESLVPKNVKLEAIEVTEASGCVAKYCK